MSPALRVARGWVFVTVTGKQDPYVPQLAEVRDKVRDDLVRERAAEIAKTKAAEIAATLKARGRFRGGGEEGRPRGEDHRAHRRAAPPFRTSASSAEIDKVAFALPKGGVSDPISTPQGTAIIRVVEKEDVTDEQIATGRDQLREELVNQRRDQFFSGYMQKAKKNLKIEMKPETLARVVGRHRRRLRSARSVADQASASCQFKGILLTTEGFN